MELNVKGMHCRACVMLVTEALEENGAKNISIQLDEKNRLGKVKVETTLSKQQLKQIIESQGEFKVQ